GSSHSNGYSTRDEVSQYEWILDNTVQWNKAFGIHNINLTLLYSVEQRKDWLSSMSNQGFMPNENLNFHGLQFGNNPSLNTSDSQITGDAIMARLNYNILGKYLFTASVRRDGYSAFGIKNPRATFPAAAVAWRV